MNVHKNAKLTPRGRAEIVRRVIDQGQTPKAVATAFGVCERTVRKWVARFRAEGSQGLQDRSSRPHTLHRPTPAPVVKKIAALRRQRCTGAQIAAQLGVSTATVSRVLRRLGLNRLKALEPAEPVRRYEPSTPASSTSTEARPLRPPGPPRHRRSHRARMGVSARVSTTTPVSPSVSMPDEAHDGRFDRRCNPRPQAPAITANGKAERFLRQSNSRGIGWDARLYRRPLPVAFSQIMPDEKKESATAFLKAALDYYKSLGVSVSRVMTDNGSCYKAFAFRDACRTLGLKHIRTRPYTPKTNGKERFIQTALREWAYARATQANGTARLAPPIQLRPAAYAVRPHRALCARPARRRRLQAGCRERLKDIERVRRRRTCSIRTRRGDRRRSPPGRRRPTAAARPVRAGRCAPAPPSPRCSPRWRRWRTRRAGG